MKSTISVKEINRSSILREGFIINEDLRIDNLIADAASKIFLERHDKPIVLLSGPSGSGKTTTAFKIGKCLEANGVIPHIISMDNYFSLDIKNLNPEELEKPERVDIPFLQEHLHKLLNGHEIEIPKFDFKTQTRNFSGETLRLSEDSLLILEGIHVLNPMIVGDILEQSCGVYVSVRTRVSNGELLLHPKNIRLLRRVLRDTKYRGQNIIDVIEKAKHVDAGEDAYIMPYKNNADIQINTFVSYELPVLKYFLYNKLRSIDKGFIDENGLSTLVQIMEGVDEIDDTSCIQSSAILREFIGNSEFKY